MHATQAVQTQFKASVNQHLNGGKEDWHKATTSPEEEWDIHGRTDAPDGAIRNGTLTRTTNHGQTHKRCIGDLGL